MNLIEKAAGRIAESRGQKGGGEPRPAAIPHDTEGGPPHADRAADPHGEPGPVVKFARRASDEAHEDPAATRGVHGNINLARLKQAGMITPDGERTQLAEEFRQIKRPLLTNAFSHGAAPLENGNLIMVTSSLPGEGKSFCAINLAMSIAMEMDHTVLLVDADVAKPSLPQYLGLKEGRGLLDLLLDESLLLSDVLIRTNVEKLTVLPAGRGHRYATELLASTAMNRLLDEMGRRYPDRVIIFDSPPLLVTSEARVLATHMGQIVMVVEAEKTSHEAVKEALKHIDSCDVVGLLLNKGNFLPGTDYYYYGSYGVYAK